MDINNLFRDSGFLDKLAGQFGVEPSQVEEVVNRAVPEMTRGLNANTSTEEGFQSFLKALQDHKDDPVDDMLAHPERVDTNDGDKILSHIFGDRKEPLTQELSEKQGLSASSVGGIIKFIAPILMGMLGRQAMNRNQTSGGGGLLDLVLGNRKTKDGNILDSLTDRFLR